MECLTTKETIGKTIEIVKETSYAEKKSHIPERDDIDKFLDTLLIIQKKTNESSEKVEYINDCLEKLTWLNEVDEDSLKEINSLVGSAKYLHSILARQYILIGNLRKKGLSKEVIKRFKDSIDNLKESIFDLDSVFFGLPQIPGFLETTKELSLI